MRKVALLLATCCVQDAFASTLQFFSTPKTWASAQSDCVSRGGDLASIRSAEENTDAPRAQTPLAVPGPRHRAHGGRAAPRE